MYPLLDDSAGIVPGPLNTFIIILLNAVIAVIPPAVGI